MIELAIVSLPLFFLLFWKTAWDSGHRKRKPVVVNKQDVMIDLRALSEQDIREARKVVRDIFTANEIIEMSQEILVRSGFVEPPAREYLNIGGHTLEYPSSQAFRFKLDRLST